MKRLRQNRIKKPANHRSLLTCQVKYDNAQKLAADIDIANRTMCLVAGNFIFGDFVEALIVEKNYHVKRLDLSTLSLSEENIDSLVNLIDGGFVEELNLHTSAYFFSHERNGLIKSIFEKLDKADKFQLTVSGNHTKIILIETYCGKHIIIHGSANLRSSDCIEQFIVEDDTELYDFNRGFFDIIIEKFNTINKEISGSRGKTLWKTVLQEKSPKSQKKINQQKQSLLDEAQKDKNNAWEI